MPRRLPCAALFVVAATGCNDADCSGGEKVSAPLGSPDDFTLELGNQPGYRLEAPVDCELGGVPGYWIGIAGTGERLFDRTSDGGCPEDGGLPEAGAGCDPASREAFIDELQAALEAAGVSDAQISTRTPLGGWPCSSALPSLRVTVGDWHHADAAASALASKVASWDLGEYVGLELGGQRAYLCG